MTKQFGTPGPRSIYPEMAQSPSLGRCGLLANLLFPRLLAAADDQGRLQGGAHSVLLVCLPRLLRLVTIDQVEEALEELERESMVRRYTVRNESYLQVLGWWRWQSGARRAYASRLPAPRGWTDLVYGTGEGAPASFNEALEASPRRNAAACGSLRRRAARATGARAGARAPGRAQAQPDRALTDAVPSGAPAREGSGGPRGGAMEKFSDLVPRPPT